MQHVLVEAGLRRRRDGHETHDQYHIATHAMVLVDTLCPRRAAEQAGGVVLGDADDGLQEEEDVGDEAEDGVWGLEVGA